MSVPDAPWRVFSVDPASYTNSHKSQPILNRTVPINAKDGATGHDPRSCKATAKANIHDILKPKPQKNNLLAVFLTLEQTVSKYFRYSSNNNDKLFTEDIIEKIRQKLFVELIYPKKLQKIILKCGLGARTQNGKIWIGGIQNSGYKNITFLEEED